MSKAILRTRYYTGTLLWAVYSYAQTSLQHKSCSGKFKSNRKSGSTLIQYIHLKMFSVMQLYQMTHSKYCSIETTASLLTLSKRANLGEQERNQGLFFFFLQKQFSKFYTINIHIIYLVSNTARQNTARSSSLFLLPGTNFVFQEIQLDPK